MKQQATTTAPTLTPQVGTRLQRSTTGAVDTETLALLDAWAVEDATYDPEKLRIAQKELDEFKRAMNENRAATGERILYP